MSKKLFLNSLSGTTLYGINVVVTFIMSPVIIRSLGNRDYGLWEMMMSVVGYMGLLDLGIGPALLRYVAVAHAKGEREELQKIISTAQLFFVVVGFLAALVMLGLSCNPALIIGEKAVNSSYLTTVFILFALNTTMSFPLGVFTAVLMGVQCHYYINAVRIILAIARAGAVYVLLTSHPGKGLLILAGLEVAAKTIQFSLFYLAIRRDSTIPCLDLSVVSWMKLKELFVYGSKSATLMVASRIQNASLPFVINAVLGVSNIVYFAMPNRLIDYAKGLSLAMGFPLTPYFAAQMTGDSDSLKDRWLQSSLAFQIVTLAMPFFVLFCGETFITVWIGKEYAMAGKGVLYCLTAALFVEALAPNANRLLMASGRHGRAAIVWLALSIVSVPLAVVGAYQWGIAGVALGSSISLIVGTVVTLQIACREIGISIGGYLHSTVVRLIIPVTLLGAALWFMGNLLDPDSYLSLALQVLASAVVYLITVWFLTLTQETRSRITKRINMLKKPH